LLVPTALSSLNRTTTPSSPHSLVMSSDTNQPVPVEPPTTPGTSPRLRPASSAASSSPEPTQPAGGRPSKIPSPSRVPRPPQRQLSLSDPNLRNCFICLQNSNETPDANWVNPCPCTLEAHETCLLRWVAETEGSAVSSKKKLRCPACNGRIYVVQPSDPIIKFRQRMNRLYSRVSPGLLLTILYSMGVAGSGFFGLVSLQAIAGYAPVARWLGRDVLFRPSSPRDGFAFGLKIFVLHLIVPGLLLHRALGSLLSVVTVPASFIVGRQAFLNPPSPRQELTVFCQYGATLVWRDHMPAWPPSPAWALTMLPYLTVTYNSVYWEFFGSLERRLNRALRGRPANEETLQGGLQGDAAAPEQREDGPGTLLWRLGHGVLNILAGEEEDGLGGDPGEGEGEGVEGLRLQLELVVEDGGDGDGDGDGDNENDGNQMPPAGAGLPPPGEEAGHPPAQQAEQAAAEAGGNEEQPQANPEDEPEGREGAEEQPAAQNPVPEPGNNHQPVEQDNRGSPTLSDIVNATVTQLLFPFLSAGIGGALYLTLPRTWVRRVPGRPPTGFLQERWGRSLVGGGLFVVFRDAFNLYTKYRRVQVKKHRKVVDQGRRVTSVPS